MIYFDKFDSLKFWFSVFVKLLYLYFLFNCSLKEVWNDSSPSHFNDILYRFYRLILCDAQ